jgi:hypothetical protein
LLPSSLDPRSSPSSFSSSTTSLSSGIFLLVWHQPFCVVRESILVSCLWCRPISGLTELYFVLTQLHNI